ncbi:unnamed protein product [Mytilus edulis]|uniref:Uncharacterized protein n=1 Tax=Mytilus edulis TaxID=6550 RepID=A0A8S3RSJ0_MYTED|nr:unnamed protein product [Mytilus edulis]
MQPLFPSLIKTLNTSAIHVVWMPVKPSLYANLRHVVPAVCLPGPFGSHFDECAFMMNANPEHHPNSVMDIIYDETPSLRMFITKNGGFQTLKRQLAQRFGPFKFEDDDDGKLVLLRVIEIQEGVNRLYEMVTAYFNQPLWQDIQHVSNQIIYGDDASEEELEEAEHVIPEHSPSKYL